jgi:hypothetical protein
LAGPAGISAAGAWIAGFAATIGTGGLVAVGAAIVAAFSIKSWINDYDSEAEKNKKAIKDRNERFFTDIARDADSSSAGVTSRLAKIQKERAAAEADLNSTSSYIGEDHEKLYAERKERLDRLAALESNTTKDLKKIQDDEAKKRLENTQGTKEWIAKNSEKALKDLGPVTIENATERFKQIEQLSKKVMSPDFKIQDKIDAIREKLTGIKWFIMDEPQQTEMNTALARLQTVQQIMANIADIGGTTKAAADKLAALGNAFSPDSAAMKAVGKDGNLSKAINATKDMFAGENKIDVAAIQTASIGLENARKMFQDAAGLSSSMTEFSRSISSSEGVARKGIASTLKAVEDMVAATKKMDAALASIDKIDIGARLTQVAGAMGLGGSASKTYTVQSKEVVLHVTFNVSMDAQELEKVMIGNNKSIIRDRINFALDRGAKSDPNTKGALLKPRQAAITGYYGSDIPGSN